MAPNHNQHVVDARTYLDKNGKATADTAKGVSLFAIPGQVVSSAEAERVALKKAGSSKNSKDKAKAELKAQEEAEKAEAELKAQEEAEKAEAELKAQEEAEKAEAAEKAAKKAVKASKGK